jgi:hypothetical protein
VSNGSSDEDAVLSAEARRYDAIVAADWDTFEACCHEDLLYTHSTAIVDTRDDYLAKLREGWYVYHWIEHPVDRVVIRDRVALVFGTMRAHITAGGVEKDLDNQSLSVLEQTDDGWKLLAYQPTPRQPS